MDVPASSTEIENVDALSRLRGMIADGSYGPGDRLPPEREMIRQFGVTRSTLRRALEKLEREGLIWRHVGKGTFVSDPAVALNGAGGFPDLERHLTPMKVMRARLCIEPAIAREAAINASAEAINRLMKARDLSRAAESWEDYEARDDQFHRAVAAASDNLLLVSIFDRLNEVRRAIGWSQVVRSSARPDANHRSFAEHDRITDAIAAHDPAAAQEAMRGHIGSVSARLFGDL